MFGPMFPDEVLAIGRLRQWSADRAALRAARTAEYKHRGWQARNCRTFDSRIVRSMDFERVMATLPAPEQLALILIYRDGHTRAEVAKSLRCSERKISYLVPQARQRLARILDRLDLL